MWSQRARCTKSHIHLCYDRSLSRCRSYSPNRTTFWSETTVRHDDKPDRTDVDFYDAITELYRIRLHSNLSAVPVTSLAALKPTITTKQKRHKNSDTLKLSRCETGLQASSNFQIRRSVLETSQMIDRKELHSDLQFSGQKPNTRRVPDKATSEGREGGLDLTPRAKRQLHFGFRRQQQPPFELRSSQTRQLSSEGPLFPRPSYVELEQTSTGPLGLQMDTGTNTPLF